MGASRLDCGLAIAAKGRTHVVEKAKVQKILIHIMSVRALETRESVRRLRISES